MRTGVGGVKFAAAAVAALTSALFLLSGQAKAGQRDPRGEVPGVQRPLASARVAAGDGGGSLTEKHANCGKCHSACEDGRSHEGRQPVDERRTAGLPLDEEGRATCATCHDPGRHDQRGEAGGRLRISNLRRELCLACHRHDAESAPRIEIVSPLEGALIQEEHLALIGRSALLPGSELTVRLNGSEFHVHVKDGGFSTWLRLQEGVNRVEIAQGELLLWKGEVFHGESAMDGYERASSGHLTGNRAQCLECHGKMTELNSAGKRTETALCYGCHDLIGGKRYVHGPLAVGDCLACHDPHGGYGSAHLRLEQGGLCGKCHAARDTVAAVACNAPGKGCVDCHDPHQSDTRYLLKGPQYTMRDKLPVRR